MERDRASMFSHVDLDDGTHDTEASGYSNAPVINISFDEEKMSSLF